MILPHIHIKPTRPRNLLQLALRPLRSPQPIQPAHNPHHRRQRDLARLRAQTRVRSDAIVDIVLQRAVRFHLLRGGEHPGVLGGADEGHEDLVAGLHGDVRSQGGRGGGVDFESGREVGNSGGGDGFAVGAVGAVEADAFHHVVEERAVGLDGGGFGEGVDGGEVLLAVGGEVEVEGLGELYHTC